MLRKTSVLVLALVACSAFARVRSVSHPDSRITDSGTVSGVISSVNGNLVQIADGAVTIDASQAKIVVGRGREATVADLEPGMQLFAAIRASNPSSHGGIPATLITATNPADVTISGAVQAVDTANRTFIVLNQGITVDNNTSFGGYRREAGTSFADVQPNVIVHVAADNVGGKLIAREVLIVAPAPPQIGHARGTVQSIGSDSWTVKTDRETLTLVIDAQTKIAGSPKVGDTVEVLYRVDAAHRYIAVSIIKFERVDLPMVRHFNGSVKSISATSWVVTVDGADRTFTVDASTKIMPNDIKVGDRVDVLALTRDNGATWQAVSIVRLRL
jgi:Domain of unknown function (DUF5666)